MTATTDERLLGSKQAALFLAVNVETLRRWAREGRVPSYRIAAGRHRRFRRSDLEALLAKSEGPTE